MTQAYHKLWKQPIHPRAILLRFHLMEYFEETKNLLFRVIRAGSFAIFFYINYYVIYHDNLLGKVAGASITVMIGYFQSSMTTIDFFELTR